MRKQSLKNQATLLIVLLIVVPCLLIIVTYTLIQVKTIKQEKMEQISQRTELQQMMIEDWIQARARNVREISKSEAFLTLDELQMKNVLNLMQKENIEFDSVSYIDKNGLFRMSTLPGGIKFASTIGKPYFQAAMEGKEYISDVVIGRNSGLPIINFSSPVFDKSGQFQGLILGSVRTATIHALLSKSWFGKTGEVLLVNKERMLIAEPRNAAILIDQGIVDDVSAMKLKDTESALKNIHFGKNGSTSWVDHFGNQVLGVYRYIPERGWMIIGKISEEELLKPVYDQLLITTGITVSFVLLMLPLAAIITDRFKRPIEWLVEQSRLVSEEQYALAGRLKYNGSAPAELRILCDAFSHMSNKIESTVSLLKEREDNLETKNNALKKEIIERQTVQADLQSLNDKLEAEITRRTHELQQSEQLYRTLVDNSPDIITRYDRDYRFIFGNLAFTKATGITVDQMLGKTWTDRGIFEEKNSEWIQKLESVFRNGTSVEFETVESNQICTSVRFVPEWNEQKQIETVLSIARDITKQKQAEELFYKAFSLHPSMMAIKSCIDATYIDVNEAYARAVGLPRDQIIGRPVGEIEINLGADLSRQEVRQLLSCQISLKNHEIQFCTTSQEKRTALLTSEQIIISGKPCCLQVITDITDKKQYEAEYARFDSLNVIGEMAASIGHEVRNPMTTVRGYLQFFQNKEVFSGYSEQFSVMIEELDRANAIVTEFLSLAKDKAVEMKRGNLSNVILALFPLLQADALRRGHHIGLELSELPDSDFDDKEMRQILLNLIRNSFEAMDRGGKVVVRGYKEENDIRIEVQDNGSGIPDHVMAKLGTPFVTTKDHGIGLGLPVCYRIAGRHGAKIRVKTDSNGTTFTLLFPIPNTVDTNMNYVEMGIIEKGTANNETALN